MEIFPYEMYDSVESAIRELRNLFLQNALFSYSIDVEDDRISINIYHSRFYRVKDIIFEWASVVYHSDAFEIDGVVAVTEILGPLSSIGDAGAHGPWLKAIPFRVYLNR